MGSAADAAQLAQDTFVCGLLQRTERLEFKAPRAPKVRQAFLLAQCEGLTHKHIAEQMGLSLRSVERYVGDALYHCYVLRYET